MPRIMDFLWFQEEVMPTLIGYDVNHNFFEDGDFGSLNQIQFNSIQKGGEIEFWSSGYLGIHLVDYENEIELLNFLIEPSRTEEKEKAIETLLSYI
jgi:hypothetical protein